MLRVGVKAGRNHVGHATLMSSMGPGGLCCLLPASLSNYISFPNYVSSPSVFNAPCATHSGSFSLHRGTLPCIPLLSFFPPLTSLSNTATRAQVCVPLPSHHGQPSVCLHTSPLTLFTMRAFPRQRALGSQANHCVTFPIPRVPLCRPSLSLCQQNPHGHKGQALQYLSRKSAGDRLQGLGNWQTLSEAAPSSPMALHCPQKLQPEGPRLHLHGNAVHSQSLLSLMQGPHA